MRQYPRVISAARSVVMVVRPMIWPAQKSAMMTRRVSAGALICLGSIPPWVWGGGLGLHGRQIPGLPCVEVVDDEAVAREEDELGVSVQGAAGS